MRVNLARSWFNVTTLPIFLVAAITFSEIASPDDPKLFFRPVLTLEIAKAIAEACESRQIKQKKPPVSIAIYDQGVDLVLFHRMAGAPLGAVIVAMEKGKTSASFPVSTKQWKIAAFGENGTQGIAHLPNITTIEGGVPIVTQDGVHLGGIGVSGSSGEDDEACAKAGLGVVEKSFIVKSYNKQELGIK